MPENLVFSIISKIAWDLMFDSDEDDDDEEQNLFTAKRRRIAKNMGFWEDTIPKFDSQQFKCHFRLSPESFQFLYQNLVDTESRLIDVRRGRPNIQFEKQILATLWFLANMECFRFVADRFGISVKACWSAVYHICAIILKLNEEKHIITWSNSRRSAKTADHFPIRHIFPGMEWNGCIDGSHIQIAAPKEHPNSYINRKKFHSVLLQAVCKEEMLFTNCFAGEAGSIHDSCLFRRLNLFKQISDGTIVIPEEQHILGDQGYGLKQYLMIPFKDNGNLSETQKRYNRTLSSSRAIIERAFALLKGRFRRLQKIETKRLDYIPLVIMTACILHNICIQQRDYIDFEYEDYNNDEITPAFERHDSGAQLKRNRIANQLLN